MTNTTNVTDRILIFDKLFVDLQSTNSRLDKETIVADFEADYPDLQDDWNYILQVLDNRYPLYYSFVKLENTNTNTNTNTEYESIKEMLSSLKIPITSNSYIEAVCRKHAAYADFIEPIVNRRLRLGIGKSLLGKTSLTPMLAKAYRGEILYNDVIVTEKLDGNRCIASYDNEKNEWNFTSRSGKIIDVDFDMSGMSTQCVYDGEIMSEKQTSMSIKRTLDMHLTGTHSCVDDESRNARSLLFNITSGLINRKGAKSGLVYNVFDIICAYGYAARREMLDQLSPSSANVRIVPSLYCGTNTDIINETLDFICSTGGEGVMLNQYNRVYEHKRSDALLKYKQVQTMDMRVVNVYEGKGKYDGCAGGLVCTAITEDGRMINCEVGSGLTDIQRIEWGHRPDLIIGKIIEVAYHEMTQDRHRIGTMSYSLRFPRLKAIRDDKSLTSAY